MIEDNVLPYYSGYTVTNKQKLTFHLKEVRMTIVVSHSYICDRICEKGSYTHFQLCNFDES